MWLTPAWVVIMLSSIVWLVYCKAPVYSLFLHSFIPFVESFWTLRGTQRPWPPALASPFSSGNPCIWPASLTHPIIQCHKWLTFILCGRIDASWYLVDSSTIYVCYIQSSVRTYLLGRGKSQWRLRYQFQLSLWSYHIRAYLRDVRARPVSDACLPFREAYVHERIRYWNMCVYNLRFCHAMMCMRSCMIIVLLCSAMLVLLHSNVLLEL